MKKILAILACLVVAGICFARPDGVRLEITGVASNTIATNATGYIEGFIDFIYVDVPNAWTGSVIVADRYETILNVSNISVDTIYRPRTTVDTVTGGEIVGATLTNAQFFLYNHTLTSRVITTVQPTNAMTLHIGLDVR